MNIHEYIIYMYVYTHLTHIYMYCDHDNRYAKRAYCNTQESQISHSVFLPCHHDLFILADVPTEWFNESRSQGLIKNNKMVDLTS